MLAGGLKLLALVWLYTDAVTGPGLSPGSVPDRLFWLVGNGTVSVVPPPVSVVARTCPSNTPSRVKFTTGNPEPKSPKPLPLSVKLVGAAPRSIGLGVIALTLGATGDSSTSTQSWSPPALFPGVVKFSEPVFGSGESGTGTKVPAAGSYQRAITGPLSRLMSTVTVRVELPGVAAGT